MKQYLDKADGKWHIELVVSVPPVIVKNKLNFRLKSVTMKDGSVIKDPDFAFSKYIFAIHRNALGKKVVFNAFFSQSKSSKIKSFQFGFCDEMVKWFNDTLFDVENTYEEPTPIVIEEAILTSSELVSSESEQIGIEQELPAAQKHLGRPSKAKKI